MQKVKQQLLAAVKKNKAKDGQNMIYMEMLTESLINKNDAGATMKNVDHMDNILDIRCTFYCNLKLCLASVSWVVSAVFDFASILSC